MWTSPGTVDTINALDAMRGPMRHGEVIEQLLTAMPDGWKPEQSTHDPLTPNDDKDGP